MCRPSLHSPMTLKEILEAVRREPGLTTERLAARARVSVALMTDMLERLEARGSIERVKLPGCPGGCSCACGASSEGWRRRLG